MIAVKYFGVVAEKTYCHEEKFSFSNLPLDVLIETIEHKYHLEQVSYRIAINKKMMRKQSQYILQSDDVVALLPPFAGG
jgi:sulfur-carrier protein